MKKLKERSGGGGDDDGAAIVLKALEDRLASHDENRKSVQGKLSKFCNGLRKQVDDLESRINSELEGKFRDEDTRLQSMLNNIRTLAGEGDSKKAEFVKALQRAKAELLLEWTYELKPMISPDFPSLCKLSAAKKFSSKWIDLEGLNSFKISRVESGRVYVDVSAWSEQRRVLTENGFDSLITHKASLSRRGSEGAPKATKEYPLLKEKDNNNSFYFVPTDLETDAIYDVKTRVTYSGKVSQWGSSMELGPVGFNECCAWKKCPNNIDKHRKYSVDEKNTRIATKVNERDYCTIIGNTHIPVNNRVTSWSIKILEPRWNDGDGIYVGVAPSDINQNKNENFGKRGWYFDCFYSTLWPGPPHNYIEREYGPKKKGNGNYVKEGDNINVVMEMSKGELSFIVAGVNCGVAYEGIPLDRPLVPCVILEGQGDSVELIL